MYKLFFLILFFVLPLVALPCDISPSYGRETLTVEFQPKTISFAVNYRLKGKAGEMLKCLFGK